MKYPPLEVACH